MHVVQLLCSISFYSEHMVEYVQSCCFSDVPLLVILLKNLFFNIHVNISLHTVSYNMCLNLFLCMPRVANHRTVVASLISNVVLSCLNHGKLFALFAYASVAVICYMLSVRECESSGTLCVCHLLHS